MATNDNNPASTINVTGPTVSHPLFRSAPIRGHSTGELADDATFALNLDDDGDASGFYLCWNSADPSDAALFSITASGSTVSAVDIGPAWGSHTWDDADTDVKLCLFEDSGVATLKNRSGGALTLVIARIA
tara:strand:+ start:1787 stop:2179 length:393 start_codon:yes stop_codon:yes gene_type:complete